jgi:autotransporter-associated beta strand protein
MIMKLFNVFFNSFKALGLVLMVLPSVTFAQLGSYAAGATSASGVVANMTFGTLARGTGVNSASASGYYVSSTFDNTTRAAARTANEFHGFSVQANSGYTATYTSFAFTSYRTSAGPTVVGVGYSTDGGSTWTDSPDYSLTAATTDYTNTWDFADFTTTSSVIFRVYGWSASSTGNLRTKDFVLNGSVAATSCTTADVVTSLAATNANTQSVLSWTNGSCFDEMMVVARASSAVSFTPTGDGTAYTANAVFGSGTDVGSSQFVIYKGAGTGVTNTGLTNGTTYNYAVYTRKGTTWSAAVTTTATPVATFFYWDADASATAATGGTGTWDASTTSNWRSPTSTGSLATWSTNTTPVDAIFAGTAGTVTATGGPFVAPNFNFNTTGYTLATASSTGVTLTGNIVLGNNVNLNLAPNVNTTTPVSGTLSLGNISGTGTAGLTIAPSQATSLLGARINIAVASGSISVPITIVSAGGSGSLGFGGIVATAVGTSLSSAATITNNTAIRTIVGATSGSDLTVNSVISGSGDLQFSAGASGGAGTVTLNAANNYTGATIFNAASSGIIKLGTNNALPTTTDVTMANSSGNGGILDLNGFDQTIGSLTNGVGSGSIRNNGASDKTLTVSGSTSPAAFSLAITDGTTNKTLLTRSGTGTLELTGTNTYTGLTTVSGGTLKLNKTGGTTILATNSVSVTGGTLQVSTNQTLNNLIVNGGTVTVDDGVTLTINGTLTLTTGNITLGATGTGNVIVTSISGGSSTSYVVTNGSGSLKALNFAGEKTFPVGTATIYAPVKIDNSAPSRDFSVKVGTTFSGTPAVTAKMVQLQWDVTPSVPTGNNAALTFEWPIGSEGGSFIRGNAVEIAHYNGTIWDAFKLATIAGSGPYTATASGFTSFSPFTVGNQNALSVDLLNISAQSKGTKNVITWSTASEKNNAYFEVQHATNGLDFQTVSEKIKSNGTTTVKNDYTFEHSTPSVIRDYYRLKQVDNDGTATLSKVVSVVATGKNGALKVYPTLATDKLNVSLESKETVDFNIYNLVGQAVQSGQLTGQKELIINHLPSGVYFLKVGNATVKFSKN